MSNVVEFQKTGIPALAMDEQELVNVLSTSLYPGAQLASIKLVIGYCKASQLDPMQKPVHIVPMSVKTKGEDGKDEYVMRDVIMPGVGLYRTQAARTNEYAGVSEPEFGPIQTLKFKRKVWTDGPNGTRTSKWADAELEYPEWCKVTVQRIVQGQIRNYTAVEFWIENYATAGKDTEAPNAMWCRRPRGQLAKCAEAQALRKAFPEQTGAQPTADEMEGKHLDYDPSTIDGDATGAIKPTVRMPQAKAMPSAAAPSAAGNNDGSASGATGVATIGEQNHIKAKLAALGLNVEDALAENGLTPDLSKLTPDGFIVMKEFIARQPA